MAAMRALHLMKKARKTPTVKKVIFCKRVFVECLGIFGLSDFVWNYAMEGGRGVNLIHTWGWFTGTYRQEILISA